LLFVIAILAGSCAGSKKTSGKMNSDFPQSWVGNWEGTLQICSSKGVVQQLPMEIEISKVDTAADRYHFALIYGEDKKAGLRPYQLIIKDREKGHFVNDEMNGIRMDEYFIGNKLYCWFEVEGTLLLSSFEKKNNLLHFEIIAGSSTPVSTSGGTKHEGEDIPVVKTYPVKNVQKAVLKRKR
jgi:hypothetical protein